METIIENAVLNPILPAEEAAKRSLFVDTSSPLTSTNHNLNTLLSATSDMASNVQIMSAPMPMTAMSSLHMVGNYSAECPEFGLTSQTVKLLDVSSQSFQVAIDARLQGGFFKHDDIWTCYRRNFIRVSCSMSLINGIGGGSIQSPADDKVLFVELNGERVPVTSFYAGLRATTNMGVSCELVMFSSRRDKKAQHDLEPRLIRPGGSLNQRRPSMLSTPKSASSNESGGSTGCSSLNNLLTAPPADVVHFERVQFRAATSNNGKRKSIQQYFRMIIYVDAVLSDGRSVEIACCESSDIVVRGRSPGHYADVERIKERKYTGKRASIGDSSAGVWSRRPSFGGGLNDFYSASNNSMPMQMHSAGSTTTMPLMRSMSESLMTSYPNMNMQTSPQLIARNSQPNIGNHLSMHHGGVDGMQVMNNNATTSSFVPMQMQMQNSALDGMMFAMNTQQKNWSHSPAIVPPSGGMVTQQQQQQHQHQHHMQMPHQNLYAPLAINTHLNSNGMEQQLMSPTGRRMSLSRDPLLMIPETTDSGSKGKFMLPLPNNNNNNNINNNSNNNNNNNSNNNNNIGGGNGVRMPLKSPGAEQFEGQLFGNFSSLAWQ